MKPVKTPDTNMTFKLAEGTDDNDLPVEKQDAEGGSYCFVSTWELTDQERALLANHPAKIDLCVWGLGHPPVALRVNIGDIV